jgi:hypothetical protein
VLLSIFLWMLMFVAPVIDHLLAVPPAIFANRSHVILHVLPVAAGTWIALRLVARLRPLTRPRVLAAALALSGAAGVVDIYAQSALADLHRATFITAIAVLLALAALLRGARPGRPVEAAPAVHDRPT